MTSYINVESQLIRLNRLNLNCGDTIRLFLLTASTVDAVEVTRCKDCKWFGKVGCGIMITDDFDKPTENDYCSFAERGEDAEPN